MVEQKSRQLEILCEPFWRRGRPPLSPFPIVDILLSTTHCHASLIFTHVVVVSTVHSHSSVVHEKSGNKTETDLTSQPTDRPTDKQTDVFVALGSQHQAGPSRDGPRSC